MTTPRRYSDTFSLSVTVCGSAFPWTIVVNREERTRGEYLRKGTWLWILSWTREDLVQRLWQRNVLTALEEFIRSI